MLLLDNLVQGRGGAGGETSSFIDCFDRVAADAERVSGQGGYFAAQRCRAEHGASVVEDDRAGGHSVA